MVQAIPELALPVIESVIGGGGEAAGGSGGSMGDLLGGAKNATGEHAPTTGESGKAKVPEAVTNSLALSASHSALAGIH